MGASYRNAHGLVRTSGNGVEWWLAAVGFQCHHICMSDHYLPPSAFLQEIINENVPFGERDIESINLNRLIAMTRNVETANRDWAVFLLAQLQMNTATVRKAFQMAASDENTDVRAEAILGLAQCDRSAALPYLQKELRCGTVTMPLLEAAAIVAHFSLIPDLEAFAAPSDNQFLDGLVDEAIVACQAKLR